MESQSINISATGSPLKKWGKVKQINHLITGGSYRLESIENILFWTDKYSKEELNDLDDYELECISNKLPEE